ncbi:MAG: hypothetical protein WA431_03790 [Candidatus Cybelea sp.]
MTVPHWDAWQWLIAAGFGALFVWGVIEQRGKIVDGLTVVVKYVVAHPIQILGCVILAGLWWALAKWAPLTGFIIATWVALVLWDSYRKDELKIAKLNDDVSALYNALQRAKGRDNG